MSQVLAMVCAPQYTREAANESESIEDAMKTLDVSKYQWTSWVWEAPSGFCGRVIEPVFAVYPAEMTAVADMPKQSADNPHADNEACLMTAHTHDGWVCKDPSFESEFRNLKVAARRAFENKDNPYAPKLMRLEEKP